MVSREADIPAIRRIISSLLIAAAALAMPAGSNASITDNPRWAVPPIIVVWTSDGDGNGPLVSEFLVGTPAGDTLDLIPTDATTVVTGSLSPTDATDGTAFGGIPYIIEGTGSGDFNTDTSGNGVLDADDSFSPFNLELGADTRVDAVETATSFYVASNSPFNINADVVSVNNFGLLFAVFLDMSVSLERTDPSEPEFGNAAQFPHSGGATSGFVGMPRTLLSVVAPSLVFAGNQATADVRGSILDHSVRFDQSYSVGFTGYDLSLGTFDFQAVIEYTVFAP